MVLPQGPAERGTAVCVHPTAPDSQGAGPAFVSTHIQICLMGLQLVLGSESWVTFQDTGAVIVEYNQV